MAEYLISVFFGDSPEIPHQHSPSCIQIICILQVLVFLYFLCCLLNAYAQPLEPLSFRQIISSYLEYSFLFLYRPATDRSIMVPYFFLWKPYKKMRSIQFCQSYGNLWLQFFQFPGQPNYILKTAHNYTQIQISL